MMTLPYPLEIVEKASAYYLWADGKILLTEKQHQVALPCLQMAQQLQQEAKQWHNHKKPDYQLWPRICYVHDYLQADTESRQNLHDKIINYANHDLLCYRVQHPPALCVCEQQQWDLWLDWAQTTHNIHLKTTDAILHIAQSDESLKKVSDIVNSKNLYCQAGLLELVEILGSVILVLAVINCLETKDNAQIDSIFNASLLHENYQAEKWGKTEEYQADYDAKYQHLTHALQFYQLGLLV
ncbi:MAG: hypothetical protein K0U45_07560 [Alphaproteobacteria bacterium]|nr:hypothetical protein [Alphaproteobacteria bacterium]